MRIQHFRGVDKSKLMVRNLTGKDRSWISYYYKGKGESIYNIKWKENRKGFAHVLNKIK